MEHALDRIRAEFLEMPGLRLTVQQANRFCGLDSEACAQVLDALVREEFLVLKPDGRYARVGDGLPRPRSAKAALDRRSHRAAS